MGSGLFKSLSGRETRWKERCSSRGAKKQPHESTPITASQAQAMVITITLVPKLHILLSRHCTHGMALSALLVQGGSEGLNGSQITMCLALLQADI